MKRTAWVEEFDGGAEWWPLGEGRDAGWQCNSVGRAEADARAGGFEPRTYDPEWKGHVLTDGDLAWLRDATGWNAGIARGRALVELGGHRAMASECLRLVSAAIGQIESGGSRVPLRLRAVHLMLGRVAVDLGEPGDRITQLENEIVYLKERALRARRVG